MAINFSVKYKDNLLLSSEMLSYMPIDHQEENKRIKEMLEKQLS